ncbi:MAG: hypothetical protein GY876_03070 [Planctomycetes bacterium]|nr:hypothetical protein [Planctomycetota bacterium]
MNTKRMPIWVFLLWLVVFECFLVTGIVLVLMYAPSPSHGPIITFVALFALAVIASAAFRLLWNPMLAAFPPQEVPVTAKKKSFQSFSFGLVNMGLSINAATDEDYLHIEPILPWRALGAASASIPFTAMTPSDCGRTVKVDKWTMAGPKWCFEKATKPPTA